MGQTLTIETDGQNSLAAMLSPVMAPDELESFIARAIMAAAGYGTTAIHAEDDNAK